MTPEQMQELVKQLGPVVAAQILEQAKSQGREGHLALLGGKNVPAPAKPSAFKSAESLGAFMRGVAAAGARPTHEALVATMKKFAGEDMAKAVQESVYDSAGVLVPVQSSSELIEYLRPVSLMDKLGIRTVPFKSEMQISKQTGTMALQWIGEGDTVSETKPSFGKIALKAHKAMALVNISNDLLRNPSVGDAFVGQDARLAMAHGLDDAMLNGSGVQNQPKGLLLQVNATNDFARAGTTAANYLSDADKAIEFVLKADLPITSPKWLMHPTKEKELKGIRFTGDGGQYVFRDEMKSGKFNGFDYVVSTRVPVTKIIFGCWDQLMYGLDQDVLVSTHADTRAAYDETLLRAILRADFKVRHDKAFAIIKDS